MNRKGSHVRNTRDSGGRHDVSLPVRLLVRDLPVPAAVVDLDGHAWIWNAAAEDLFPQPPRTSATLRYPLFSARSQPWFVTARAAVIDGRSIDEIEWLVRGAGGSHCLLRLCVSPVRNESGDVVSMLVVMQLHRRKANVISIRDRTRNDEVQLRRSEERLRGVTEALSDQGVIMLDAVGYIIGWNAGAQAITGYHADEIIGKDLSVIYTPEGVDVDDPHRALLFAIEFGKHEEEGWKRRKDGSRFWCQLSVNALFDRDRTIEGFAVVLRDLTQQRAGEEAARRTEDQLRQSQRMEAIGRLAGGIAHDFNNLLTAIQGHVQFLLDDLPSDHPSQQDAIEIRRSADRAAALTRQLLAFSRRQELQPRIVNLNHVITEMEMLLRRVISEDIQVTTNLEPELWPVRADPGQLEQVIMNLVVNARDAMPRGGAISIRTCNIDLDEGYADTKIEVGAGPYVQLVVSDTGVGMDRETQSHIFEPFFTTKEAGKGTGLGLATVYGIVKQSGGHVWVYSEPGQGTTFKIYLPRAGDGGEVLQRSPKLKDMARPGETVLIVEDEAAVRALARRVLETRGHHVLEAASGQEARRVADKCAGHIHLLLSDVVVTDSNGRRIAEELQPGRPAMRVLFMSGYTDEDVRQHGVVDAGANFLEKPFTPDLLARKVREVLDTAE